MREPRLDTGSAVRPLLIAIFGWVAEQERVTIVARTIDLARKLYADTIKALPDGVPTQFVAGALRDAITTDGKVNVRIWELALAFAVRDALRSGNLYLAESRHYVSFWKLIYSDDTWSQKRERAYADLRISSEPNHALDALRTEFDQVARSFMDGLASNRFAALRDGGLVLTRREANAEPSGVQEIRDVIGAHLQPVPWRRRCRPHP